MKPVALLVARPQSVLAQDEYDSFLKLSALPASHLVAFNLLEQPLESFDFNACSAIIITGSPLTFSAKQKSGPQERMDMQLAEICRQAYERDFPLLGVCYGLEVLLDALGGRIEYVNGEEISASKIILTPQAQTDEIFCHFPKEFYSITGHNESCTQLPESAVLLGRGENCPVQLVRVKNNLYATQFHPEITAGGLRFRLDIYDGHYFPAGQRERIEAQSIGIDLTLAHRVITDFIARYGFAPAGKPHYR